MIAFTIFTLIGSDSHAQIDTIISAENEIRERLNQLESVSSNTERTVDSGLYKLRIFLEQNNLGYERIRFLERKLGESKKQYDELKRSFKFSQSKINNLFDVIIARGKGIRDEDIKENILLRIKPNRTRIQKYMTKISLILKQLEHKIQKFDDMIGLCQIARQLDYKEEIIEKIRQLPENLRTRIRTHIAHILETVEKMCIFKSDCYGVREKGEASRVRYSDLRKSVNLCDLLKMVR